MVERPSSASAEGGRSSRSLSSLGYLAVLIFAWGGNYTWMKLALTDIGPWGMNLARFALAVVLIALAMTLCGRSSELIPPRGERLELAIVGVLQAAFITGASAVALQWIEASRTVLIAYTVPVWTMLLSQLVLKERPTIAAIAGAALGLAGLAVLTNPLAMRWDARTIPGTAAALVGTLGWALGSVLYQRRAWRSSFWQQVFWQLAATTAVMLPAWWILEAGTPVGATPMLGALVVYMALVPSTLGYWCWSRALSQMTASAASQVLLLSPVFGILQSYLVLGEPLTPALFAATLCIVAGAWVTLAARPRPV